MIDHPWTHWAGGEETEIKAERQYYLSSELEKLRKDFLKSFKELKAFPRKVDKDISIFVQKTVSL